MFVPLRPTQQDRNSSRLHDCIIKHFNFTATHCSKLISVIDLHHQDLVLLKVVPKHTRISLKSIKQVTV